LTYKRKITQMSYDRRSKRKSDVIRRVETPTPVYSRCRIIGCPNQTTAGTMKGLNRLYCRKHEEHFERHGSYIKQGYSAAQVNPYRRAAYTWLTLNRDKTLVTLALRSIEALYQHAGPHVAAFRLSGKTPEERARAAWARLREAEVDPRIPLAAWLGIEMLLLDDPQPERKSEFQRVQAAKIIHRLASGTHKKWERELSDGKIVTQEIHKYPASRGRVLRHIGEQLERAAELVVSHYLEDIRQFKVSREAHQGIAKRPHPATRRVRGENRF
jgi:hypothetical protein